MAANFESLPIQENPVSSAPLIPPPVPEPSASMALENSYKSKLQEYTQKANFPFPVYQTAREGPPHGSVFRSTVWVNGLPYVSSTAFLQRKSAEQDAARVALSAVPPLVEVLNRDEGSDLLPFINEDTTFAKSILNEYGAKKRIEKPVYDTVHTAGKVPVFTSSVAFNGKTYNGQVGRNKKESEQLAARVAILSILDSDGGRDILEIVKAKHRLYTAVNGLKETLGASNGVPVLNAVSASISTPSMPSVIQEAPPYAHEFKKPRLDADTPPVHPLITFVPGSGLAQSAEKKKRKKNKKKKKNNNTNQGLQLVNDQNGTTSAVVVNPYTQSGMTSEAAVAL